MRKTGRRILASLLAAAMLLGSVPGEALASGITIGVLEQPESETNPGTDEAAAPASGSIEGVLPASAGADGTLTVLEGTYILKMQAQSGDNASGTAVLTAEPSEDAPDAFALSEELGGRIYYVSADVTEGKEYTGSVYAADAQTAVTNFQLEQDAETQTFTLAAYAGEQKLDLTKGVLLLIVEQAEPTTPDDEQGETQESEPETEAEVTPAETEQAETETETETEILPAETESESETETETDMIVEEQGISEATVLEAATTDGKIVKLSAPEGAFPVPASEVTMTADPLTEEQKAALEEQLAARAEADGMKVTEYVAYDINLWVNGEIIQPLLPVQVTFENVAVAQDETTGEVPADMSAVETTGFQMDADTNEITSVNDTTVADDATPEDATVAVEVEHFTITGSFFTQVDPTNPNNYVFTLEQSDDGTQEDGETEDDEDSSGEVVTFEVNVESLKGNGEGELTLVPSVVDGTEEDVEAAEGEAQGTPVNVSFEADGEEISEVTNPTALNANENWTQKIQIPVSELEGVTNPMLNLSLMSNNKTITNISKPFTTMANSTQTIKGETKTITVDGTYKYSNIVVTGGGNVTIKGSGTIDAKGNGSVIRIQGGSTVILDGNVTITGGKGTEITNSEMEPRGNNKFNVGGGVYVQGGTFIMENGTIEKNEAQRGGGIFVNNGANFKMTGGTVSSNETVNKTGFSSSTNYAGEGGGIFVFGTATIYGGQIINNKCKSTTDLGGGGLYVNNNGIATLINAKVTGNIADGFGGGIAGCCHGEMSMVATDGVALYGNTAYGKNHTNAKQNTTGSAETAEIIDHWNQANSEGIKASHAMDFYTAGSTIVSNYMAGGGSAKYTGKAGSSSITIQDDEVKKYENKDVALVANPTQDSKDKVPTDCVLIFGNTSTAHGGGIGCNGGLYFGSAEEKDIYFYMLNIEISATKNLNWGSTGLKGDDFTFELLDEEKNLITTAKNDANGNVKFTLNGYVSSLIPGFNPLRDSEYTFYLRESIPSGADKQPYDQSMYKIVVEFNKKKTEKTETLKHTTLNNGFKNIKVTYHKYTFTEKKTTITKLKDENGEDINRGEGGKAESARFNNKAAVSIVLYKKGDADAKKPLQGAVFELYSDKACTIKIGNAQTTDSNGNVSWSIIPTRKNEIVYAKEITPPPGHSIIGNGITEIILNTTANYVNSKDISNKAGSFKVSKQNLGGTKLGGAEFVISTDQNGSQVVSTVYGQLKWTSMAGQDHEVKGLAAGTYWLVETKAPAGYEKAEPKQFTVKADGTLADGTSLITVTDIQNEVQISKLIYGTDTPLGGAQFKLTADGEEDRIWTSVGSNWVVKGLTVNKLYTLTEEKAPAGYTKAPTVTFKVDENGNVYDVNNASYFTNKEGVGYITVTDKLTEMKFAKVDTEGSYVSGATLAIQKKTTDASGKDVYTTVTVEPTYSEAGINGKRDLLWTSGTAPVTIKGLTAGETYYLTEIAAPDGYQRNPDRVEFTVGEVNEVTITIKDVKTVVKIAKTFEPTFTLTGDQKILFQIDEHKGAVSTSTMSYVADGSFPLTVEMTAADEGVITVEGLTGGKSYDLTEVEAPEGFIKDVKKTFTVPAEMQNGAVVELTVNVTNKATEFKVSKKSIIGEDTAYLDGATLQIFDKDGNIAKTIYGEELSWTSEGGDGKTIYGLAPGDYTLHEDVATDGYTLAQDIKFHLEVVYDETTGVGRTVVTLEDGTEVANNELIMTDKLTERVFEKLDPDGNSVEGAVLEIREGDPETGTVPTVENGGIVEDADYTETHWTTIGKPHRITGLKKGTYYLVEVEAPAGFTVANPIEFTIGKDETADQELVALTMTDELYEMQFKKETLRNSDREDTVNLAIATDPEGKEIVHLQNYKYPDGIDLSWPAKMNVDVQTFYGIPAGNYYLVELDTPTGYVKDVEPFTVTANLPVDTTVELVTLTNCETRVQLGKKFEKGEMGPDDAVVFDLTLQNGQYTVEQMKAFDVKGATVKEANIWSVTITQTTGKDKLGEVKQGDVYLSDIIYGLPVGTYTVTEVSAPAGYVLEKDIPDIEVKDEMDGDDSRPVIVDAVMNDTTKVAFAKVDENGNLLSDVELMVLDSTGKEAETIFGDGLRWTTDGSVKVFEGLAAGDYKLRELVTPAGYVKADDIPFTVAEDGTVTYKDANGETPEHTYTTEKGEEVPVVLITMVDMDTVMKVTKTLEGNYELLENDTIEFELTADGNVSAAVQEKFHFPITITLTSANDQKEGTGAVQHVYVSDEIRNLPAGDYTLTETKVPDGFTVAEPVKFRIESTLMDEDGTRVVQVADEKVTNTATEIEISKQDITTADRELPGAHLQVFVADENGEPVLDDDGRPIVATTVYNETLDWYSGQNGEEGHIIKGLKAGRYVLHEDGAPAGYGYAEDIVFEIPENLSSAEQLEKVVMQDTATHGYVSKRDGRTGEELVGAVLQIVDMAGNVMAQWTSDGEPHLVEGVLNAGETYRLVEVQAPTFYELADPITFTVNQDGSFPDVVMEDMRTVSEGATIAVTKTLTNDAGEQLNAVDATFYVALYEDSERTKRVSDVKAIEFRNAWASTVEFNNLELGKEYYIGESDENGEMVSEGMLANGTVYRANFNEGYRAVVEQPNGIVQVRFENVLYEIPTNEFYIEGNLTVTKRLLGADGVPKAGNGTFYAGIFADEACTKLSEDVSQNIIPISMNGNSQASNLVKVGFPDGGSNTVYVTEVDADGNPVAGSASFRYDVTVDGATVTMSSESNKAEVVITNQERESESEFESEFSEGESEVISSSTKSVKTGDDTPIGLYVGLLLAAALLLIVGVALKRRKRSE